MCGISGVHGIQNYQKNGGTDIIELVGNSLKRIQHRGPDHSGVLVSNQCALGHNRLRILDVSQRADQPMCDSSNRYSLVFNGEIFNYNELRKKPELSDYPFATTSDTEVLLALLIQFGKSILNELNGFFAFAFYDALTDELLLVRDRYGEKPLWYAHELNTLYFSSELRGVEAFPIPKNTNKIAIAYLLQLTYIPIPSSIYSNVHKLEAGHLIQSTSKGIVIEQWYREIENKVENENLFSLLDDAVSKRLLADVPVGAFLSGGLDSAIVCALASHHTSQLQTYSIGFPEESYLDESKAATMMANHIGASHTAIPLTEAEMLGSIKEYLDCLDEPFADSSSIALYFLCKYTKRHVSVALSGDGADELFGGYRKHRALCSAQKTNLSNAVLKKMHPLLKNSPVDRGSRWKDVLRQLSKYSGILNSNIDEAYWKLASWSDDTYISKVLGQDLFNHYQNDRKRHTKDLHPGLNSILKTDQSLVLTNDMLVKTDSMSMAHALEMRAPFLDYRIVHYANGLSAEEKINKNGQKWILRETFGHLLPPEILQGRKKGFEVPLDRWVKGPLRTEITETLSRLDSTLFNCNAVANLLSNKNIHSVPSSFIWSLFVYQKWAEKH
jgi:asparagine synthase (glutamine-hydrolysing)